MTHTAARRGRKSLIRTRTHTLTLVNTRQLAYQNGLRTSAPSTTYRAFSHVDVNRDFPGHCYVTAITRDVANVDVAAT